MMKYTSVVLLSGILIAAFATGCKQQQEQPSETAPIEIEQDYLSQG